MQTHTCAAEGDKCSATVEIHHGTRQSSRHTTLAALHARALEGAAILMRGGSRAHFFFGAAFFLAASCFFGAAFFAVCQRPPPHPEPGPGGSFIGISYHHTIFGPPTEVRGSDS